MLIFKIFYMLLFVWQKSEPGTVSVRKYLSSSYCMGILLLTLQRERMGSDGLHSPVDDQLSSPISVAA